MESKSTWARDAIERIVSTVVELVLAAALTAFTQKIRGADVVTLDTVAGAFMAAYAAGVTTLKAWVARAFAATVSPASLAPAA